MQKSNRDLMNTSTDSKLSFNSTSSNVFRPSLAKSKSFKIICVGDSMVGKTSLIQRYIENFFNEHSNTPTLSWDFREKRVQLGEGEPNSATFKPSDQVRLLVWDTAGQERFR
jgi:small GTP-binding protein